MQLTDIKDLMPGARHTQFWFTWPAGEFLVNQAAHKPYYKYLSPPGVPLRRWWRIYQVSLPEGTEICRYVVRGRKRAWVLYTIDKDGRMVRVRSEQGVPPWMQRLKSSTTGPS